MSLVVGVRLIELEHRELGIVRTIDPFVPEVVADLVHALEPADDETLEVELVGNAQKEPHVERVVVRDERPRRCSTIQRLENRRFDFEKPFGVEKGANGRGHPRAGHEERPDLGVHGEIGVTLTIPLLGIGEPRVSDDRAVDHLFLAEWERPK